ncbi:hypothetical protein SASPL_113741 [Salvia splendens]|uniref:Protein transport protein SEC23 n=1 Tax=Salvia splendens TaxID=180675 RepID=A0A8X8ZYP6_SALSN|nr:hypothetical protein SASPL_113741 [Salvia splendens]
MAAPELAQTEPEGIEGVRMTWLNWPRSKVEASKCVIPIATSIQPIRPHVDLQILPYAPLRCKTCSAVLNPFCRVDFTAFIWICPFCFQRNHFPQHYTSISQTNLPAELYPNFPSVEYLIPNYQNSQNFNQASPIYLFILDTCMIEEELEFAKSSLKRALGMLPENAMVGFISYGTQVQVHELGFSEMSKVYVFRGSKDISKDQVLEQLGLSVSGGRRPGPGMHKGGGGGPSPVAGAGPGINRFLLPASECEYTLDSLLDELSTDQWPIAPGNRALRCTGVALSVGSGLLSASTAGTGARMILLVGGPCTEGPGSIVSKDLSDPVRSHKDLDKDAAPFFKKAVHFYDELGKQLVNQGHVLDVFASALDQVGIAEMKVAIEKTGGLVVLSESFGHSVFKDSFKRIFEVGGEQSLGLAFNGTLEINCSKDIKVQGIIGPCTSLEKKGPFVASTVIGQGNSTAWKMCGLDKSTCLTVFFDVSSSEKSDPSGPSSQLYLQFLTSYQSSDGQMRLRVTTVTRRWAVGSEDLVQGFDQEVAAVVMARLASYKMEMEEGFDATRWSYGALSVFNNSPDETAYFRILLNRETIGNAVVMIQPSLISYGFDSLPGPALLDVQSIAADRILLLDSYFSVVIFHGMTIAQWRNMGYQNQPENQGFAMLLQAPREDSQLIIRDRFPVPRLVVCDQHGSQARFLLAKLNPSATYSNAQDMMHPGSDVIFTDDVSLQVFIEHLQRLAVQAS